MANGYVLDPRILTADELDWIARFDAGDEWWSREVTEFLRNDALWMGVEGLATTILFSQRGAREVVGFVAAASASLPLADLSEVVNLPPETPSRVPAVLIPYMGVSREYRRSSAHFGTEIHLQLLESIENSWPAARLIYLECWDSNKAGLEFWRRMGYLPFRRKPATRHDGKDEPLWRLFHDRFVIGEERR